MNKLTTTLALAFCAASAQAAPMTAPVCTALSNVAETTAQGRSQGVTEKQAVSLVANMGMPAEAPLNVVRWVYTLPSSLSPAQVKVVAMANCLAGVFASFTPSQAQVFK